MSIYQHHVSGFFVSRDEAEIAQAKLIALGLPTANLFIFKNDDNSPSPAPNANSNTALKGLLVDGAIGSVVGAGLGALGEVAIIAAKKDGKFADLVNDAILHGQVVLIVRTQSAQETKITTDVMQEAVGSFKDVSTV